MKRPSTVAMLLWRERGRRGIGSRRQRPWVYFALNDDQALEAKPDRAGA